MPIQTYSYEKTLFKANNMWYKVVVITINNSKIFDKDIIYIVYLPILKMLTNNNNYPFPGKP